MFRCCVGLVRVAGNVTWLCEVVGCHSKNRNLLIYPTHNFTKPELAEVEGVTKGKRPPPSSKAKKMKNSCVNPRFPLAFFMVFP